MLMWPECGGLLRAWRREGVLLRDRTMSAAARLIRPIPTAQPATVTPIINPDPSLGGPGTVTLSLPLPVAPLLLVARHDAGDVRMGRDDLSHKVRVPADVPVEEAGVARAPLAALVLSSRVSRHVVPQVSHTLRVGADGGAWGGAWWPPATMVW